MATAAEEMRLLGQLEARLAALEASVGDAAATKETMTGATVRVLKRMQGLLADHDTLAKIWSQYIKINRLLPVEGVESLGKTDFIKEEMVLADGERINQVATHLEELKPLETYANSEPIQNAPGLLVSLKPIQAVHLTQLDMANDQRRRVTELLETYNRVMDIMSQQFVYWDRIVSQAEANFQ